MSGELLFFEQNFTYLWLRIYGLLLALGSWGCMGVGTQILQSRVLP